MTNNILISIFIISIMILLFIQGRIISKNTTTQQEFVTSEDDPYLKLIAQIREDTINQIIASICMAWNINQDDLDVLVSNADVNSNLTVISCNDILFRIYSNWNSRKIRVTFSFYPLGQKYRRVSKTYKAKMKNGFVNFEKLDAKLLEWSYTYFKLLHKDLDEEMENCIMSGLSIAVKPEVDDETILNGIFQLRDEFNIRKKSKENFIDAKNFINLTAFLYRNHKEEFINFLESYADSDGKIEGEIQKEENK